MDSLPSGIIRKIARSTGRYLAELHRVDAVDAFGDLSLHTDSLDGGRPPTTLDTIGVADPVSSWPTLLEEWISNWLDRLSGGQFADLVPEVRSIFDSELEVLSGSGSFTPVIAHIDCSLDNLCFEPGDGLVTGLFDWEFTLAAPAAYDLMFVEESLAGGSWWYVPAVPDYRPMIRNALHEGYRDVVRTAVPSTGRDLYELVACLSSMTLFEDWLKSIGATDKQIEGAARQHREVIGKRI